MLNAFERLENYVSRLFPEDAEYLISLCTKGREELWGRTHVYVLGELAGLPESSPLIEKLQPVYILFAAYYFAVDAAVDGHLSPAANIRYLTHLLFLVFNGIFDDAVANMSTTLRSELRALIANRISENSTALICELSRRKTTEIENEADYQAAVGRSNVTILFYELLCTLSNKQPDPKVIKLLSDLVYFLQLGDDLGDWKEDLQTGNRTMLIRQCIQSLPIDSELDEKTIAAAFYLGGVYESYVGRVLNGLQNINNEFEQLEAVSSQKVREYIQTSYKKLSQVLDNFVSEKVRLLELIEKS